MLELDNRKPETPADRMADLPAKSSSEGAHRPRNSLALALGCGLGLGRFWDVPDGRLQQVGAEVGRASSFVVSEVVDLFEDDI